MPPGVNKHGRRCRGKAMRRSNRRRTVRPDQPPAGGASDVAGAGAGAAPVGPDDGLPVHGLNGSRNMRAAIRGSPAPWIDLLVRTPLGLLSRRSVKPPAQPTLVRTQHLPRRRSRAIHPAQSPCPVRRQGPACPATSDPTAASAARGTCAERWDASSSIWRILACARGTHAAETADQSE